MWMGYGYEECAGEKMRVLEEIANSDLGKYVIGGCLLLAQLYILNKINPLKKDIDSLWERIRRGEQEIKEIHGKLDTLCGEHKREMERGGHKR